MDLQADVPRQANAENVKQRNVSSGEIIIMANMNKKNRTEISRNDPNFLKEMKELAKFRYFKNLEKKEPTAAEMTKLIRRTNAWKQVVFELKTKPRGENK